MLKNPDTLKLKLKNLQEISVKADLIESKEKKTKKNPARTLYHLAFHDEKLMNEFDEDDEFEGFFDATFDFTADVGGTRQVLIVMAKRHYIVSY